MFIDDVDPTVTRPTYHNDINYFVINNELLVHRNVQVLVYTIILIRVHILLCKSNGVKKVCQGDENKMLKGKTAQCFLYIRY